MGALDQALAGLGNAQVTERFPSIPTGKHIFKIDRLLAKQTLKAGPAFIAEIELVSSDNPDLKPGSLFSWYRGMQNPLVALPDLKAFMLALLGRRVGTPEAAALDATIGQLAIEATADTNPLKGRLVVCEGYKNIVTKDGATKEYINARFSPAPVSAAVAATA